MDDGYLWSYFEEKSDIQDEALALIKDLKAKRGHEVKIMWCHIAGENQALEDVCKQEGLGVRYYL